MYSYLNWAFYYVKYDIQLIRFCKAWMQVQVLAMAGPVVYSLRNRLAPANNRDSERSLSGLPSSASNMNGLGRIFGFLGATPCFLTFLLLSSEAEQSSCESA